MSPRPLRGARYLRPDTSVPDLAQVITELLPSFDLEETLGFYNAFEAMEPTPFDRAVLGLNDLFYLLVALCNRRDAIHPWLFDRVREVERNPNDHV